MRDIENGGDHPDMLTDFGSVVMVVIIAVSAIIIFTLWVLS